MRSDIAMTGEVTLRGRVLPNGGIKEKALAAKRAGINHIILPKRNENDIEDIPENARKELEFHFVETLDDVFKLAFDSTKSSKRKAKKVKETMVKAD